MWVFMLLPASSPDARYGPADGTIRGVDIGDKSRPSVPGRARGQMSGFIAAARRPASTPSQEIMFHGVASRQTPHNLRDIDPELQTIELATLD
ncbi:hypothetical protein J6590_006293 [Homalodisca vitripennis]|nr:hypothetical protein J6590_006293 [Homalodisca vitripennis]